ncbi:hypothetical protein [Mycoplasma nasistruthionis]|uniref:Replicative helicase loading/DNA remodeling protein DnaB N-terminal winged helix domain-containing protein n=1 Tax=Mycoplasma nasistruthionis TaxID=353852 RepID=A0A4Y6I6V3_9MOLU|nr:hypothetical protein [Mycoplasma nasistruthionis]QDF64929.1 hypothetical protein FIV53_01225 [Mycoplasma nasistruthionis]
MFDQNSTLSYHRFVTERKEEITNDDLRNLRQFYAPLVGTEALALYQFLFDSLNHQKSSLSLYEYWYLCNLLQIQPEQLENSRKRLEGLGLMETFSINEKQITVFKLNKPLDASKFNSNSLIKDMLVDKIGKDNYARLVLSKISQDSITDNYQSYELTSDFYEIFDLPEVRSKKVSQFNVQNAIEINSFRETKQDFNSPIDLRTTLNLNNFTYTNDWEALNNLDIENFFEYLFDGAKFSESFTKYITPLVNKFKTKNKEINYVMYFVRNMYNHKTPSKIFESKTIGYLNTLIDNGLSDIVHIESYLDSHSFRNPNFQVYTETKKLLKQQASEF